MYIVQSELLRMYVRRSIMYEKSAICSPEEYSSVAR